MPENQSATAAQSAGVAAPAPVPAAAGYSAAPAAAPAFAGATIPAAATSLSGGDGDLLGLGGPTPAVPEIREEEALGEDMMGGMPDEYI